MDAFKEYKFNNKEYFNSEKLSKNIFCLPLYPEIRDKEILTICRVLKKIISKNSN